MGMDIEELLSKGSSRRENGVAILGKAWAGSLTRIWGWNGWLSAVAVPTTGLVRCVRHYR
jgi:hypothetical protein